MSVVYVYTGSANAGVNIATEADAGSGVHYQLMKLVAGGSQSFQLVNATASLPSSSDVGLVARTMNYGFDGTIVRAQKTDPNGIMYVTNKLDNSRTTVSFYTAIGGIATVTTEAALAFTRAANGTQAAATLTVMSASSGKILRIQSIVISNRPTSVSPAPAKFALRMNASASATVNSGILALLDVGFLPSSSYQSFQMPIIEGLEVSGSQTFILSQVGNNTAGFIVASILGYEYTP